MDKYAALATQSKPGLRTLDFGCGWGCLLEALKLRGIDCEGLDASREHVDVVIDAGHDCHHTADSIEWLRDRIAGGSQWNTIFLLDVLEHIDAHDQLTILELLYAGLPPGGRLVIKAPNPDSVAGMRMACIDFTHRFTPTSDALAGALRAIGFREVSTSDELQWSEHYPIRPRDMVFAESWVRRNLWLDLYYRLSKRLFRFWRRLNLASEIGIETAFQLPLSPNYLCIAQK
jgi:predicted TPR repeat methyltransferase